MRNDRGAAALELALVLPILLLLVAMVGPLAVLLYARVQLGQAGGDLVRFASSRSDVVRVAGTTTIAAGRLPADVAGAVQQEALRFSATAPITVPGSTVREIDPDCPSGRRLTLTVATTVDLGTAGAAFAGLVGAPTTLTATASNCEE